MEVYIGDSSGLDRIAVQILNLWSASGAKYARIVAEWATVRSFMLKTTKGSWLTRCGALRGDDELL